MCVQLASFWGFDVEKACLSGLLHDSAKSAKFKEFERNYDIEGIEKELGIEIAEEDKQIPPIWHAIAAQIIAERQFGIIDKEILHAIRIHPTSDSNLSLTAIVLIIADYIEPGRRFNGVDVYRKMAFHNIDSTFNEILKNKAEHVLSKGKKLHSRSLLSLKQYSEGGEKH